MKKLSKKIFASVMAIMLATTSMLGDIGSVSNIVKAEGAVTTFTNPTETSLGSVNSFAVFSNEYSQNNHMEGTIATKYLANSTSQCGITSRVSTHTKEGERILYFEDIADISKIDTKNNSSITADRIILPKDTVIDKTYNNNAGCSWTLHDKVKTFNNYPGDFGADQLENVGDSSYVIDFAEAMKGLSSYAANKQALNTEGTGTGKTIVVKDGAEVDPNQRTINVTCAEGGNVINITASDFSDYKLNVTGPEDGKYSLVVNVTGIEKDSTFTKQITVDGKNDSDSELVFDSAGKILLNFGNTTNTLTFTSQSDVGVILAPEGTVIISGATHNGSVYANSVTNNNAEIHQNPFGEYPVTPTTPATYKVKISKQDVDGSELSGAGMKLYKATDSSKAVDTWTSGTSSHEVELEAGDYVLKETSAPTGYDCVTTDMTFTVSDTGTVTNVKCTTSGAFKYDSEKSQLVVTDTATPTTPATYKVKISKQDVDGSELSGAGMKLYKATDSSKAVDTWTSGTSSHEVELEAGYYVLKETSAPTGYDCVTTDMTFTVSDTGTVTNVKCTTSGAFKYDSEKSQLVVTDTATPTTPATYKVKISKQDVDGSELSGAGMKLYKATDSSKAVDTWTSGTSSHEVELEAGDYVLKETSAPTGYDCVTTDMTFTVSDTGTVTNVKCTTSGAFKYDSEKSQLVVTDTATPTTPATYKVKISKQDVDGSELSGAGMKLYKATDSSKAVDTWTSGTSSHEVELEAGDYVLKETSAPTGYDCVTTDMTFTVSDTGTVTNVKCTTSGAFKYDSEKSQLVVTDTATPTTPATYKVKISKQDVAGKELSGACMKLYKATDSSKAVDTWTSGTSSHEVELEAGDYVLKETSAPTGYDCVTTDMTFTVSDTGTVTNVKCTTSGAFKYDSEKSQLVVTDTATPTTPATYKVKISKQDVAGKELSGAGMKLYKATDSSQAVDTWTSGTSSHEVELEAGDYVLKETSAPTGYDCVTTDMTFTVSDTGTVTNVKCTTSGAFKYDSEKSQLVVTDTATPTTPATYKVKISKQDVAGKELSGADMKLYKSTDSSKAVDTWTSGTSSHEVELEAGDYVLKETSAPTGYDCVTTDMKFTVSDKGEVTNVNCTTSGAFKYDSDKGQLVVTDKATPTTPATPSEQPAASYAVTIKKNDIDGNARQGCKYVLYKKGTDASGNATISFYNGSEDVQMIVKAENKEKTVDGKIAKWVTFAADKADEWQEVKALVDAGKIQSIETDKNGYGYAYGINEAGAYSFQEVIPPAGLLVKTTPISADVSSEMLAKAAAAVVNNTPYLVLAAQQTDPEFYLQKTDRNGNLISGAKLKISGTQDDGTAFTTSIVSTDEKVKIQLLPGTYTLSETEAPNGYKKADDITFKVDSNGSATVTSANGKIEVYNTNLTADQYIMVMVDDPATASTETTTETTTTTTGTTTSTGTTTATGTTTSTGTTTGTASSTPAKVTTGTKSLTGTSNVAKTGDRTNVAVIIVIMVIMAAGVIAVAIYKKKKN